MTSDNLTAAKICGNNSCTYKCEFTVYDYPKCMAVMISALVDEIERLKAGEQVETYTD